MPEQRVTVMVAMMGGLESDHRTVRDLILSAVEELNSGRWGLPAQEIGTMLTVEVVERERAPEWGDGSWLRLDLVRQAPPARQQG